jgi:protein gp37
MASETKIEWTRGDDGTPGKVWNPTTGCDQISPGCDNCYALTMAKRLKGMGSAKYQNDGDPRTSGPGFGIATHGDALIEPLSWRKPRRVFANSMSDLFHKDIPSDFIAQVFAVMALTPQHTFQILTKRHARMRSLLSSPEFEKQVDRALLTMPELSDPKLTKRSWPLPKPGWPLPNVWLGVSVEDQHWADIRIPALLDTPAAVRFLSCEPLLGPIDLGIGDPHRGHDSDDVHGAPHPLVCLDCSTEDREVEYFRREPGGNGIDWVILGGESGRGARPLDPAWIQSVVNECRDAGVAAFVKQLGSAWARENGADRKGGDPQYWPAGLHVREYPKAVVHA